MSDQKESKKEKKEYKEPEGRVLSQLKPLFDKLNQLIKNQEIPSESAELGESKSIPTQITEVHEEITKLAGQTGIRLADLIASGMAFGHSLTMSKYTAANDVVMIWRPINPEAAKRLEARNPYFAKGFNTKGKSSEYGPIAGDIPFDAALSKAANKGTDEIIKYQHKNDQTIKESEEAYKKIQEQGMSLSNVANINDQLLVTTTDKMVSIDGQEKMLYYIKQGEHGTEKDETTGEPLFLVEDSKSLPLSDISLFSSSSSSSSQSSSTVIKKWLAYDKSTKQFNKPYTPSTLPVPVQIIAYRQFNIETLKQEIRPVTADYDELVSAPRKLYPFHNNAEVRSLYMSLEMYDQMAEGNMTREQRVEFMAQSLFDREQRLKEEDRRAKAISTPGVGNITPWLWAGKVYQKDETGQATSHSAEVYNPRPEKFSESNYAVHLPSGGLRILRNEKDICNFINEQRKIGFPLEVNPKWDWQVNAHGDLFVPDLRLDWDPIHEALDNTKGKVESLKSLLFSVLKKLSVEENEYNWELLVKWSHANKKSTEPKEPLPDFLKRIANKKAPAESKKGPGRDESLEATPLEKPDEKEILSLVAQIKEAVTEYEKLEEDIHIINTKIELNMEIVDPPIIYSETLDPKGATPIEDSTKKSFREKVVARMQELESTKHQQRIKTLEERLANMQNAYAHTYYRHPEPFSILKYTEETAIKKQKSEQHKDSKTLPPIRSSSSSSSSSSASASSYTSSSSSIPSVAQSYSMVGSSFSSRSNPSTSNATQPSSSSSIQGRQISSSLAERMKLFNQRPQRQSNFGSTSPLFSGSSPASGASSSSTLPSSSSASGSSFSSSSSSSTASSSSSSTPTSSSSSNNTTPSRT